MKIALDNIDKIEPNKILECHILSQEGNNKISLLCRIDTLKELEYYRAGGILQYVLNTIVDKSCE